MKRFAIALCLLGATSASYAADAGMQEVTDLGRLNGQALACSQSDNVARIKSIMVQTAPKSRQLGEAFEQATHAAYLTQSSDQESCQAASVVALKAEDVAGRLRTLFPAEAAK